MKTTEVDISVVVPTHNRSDALDLTLAHLSRQDFSGGWEVIIVNNNSNDNTAEIVGLWQQNFPVNLRLLDEKKPGPAAARNAGARAASGEYLIFVDNDILTERDFISRHFARLRENPGCWIVGQCPCRPEQENTVFGRYRRQLEPFKAFDGRLIDTGGITGQGTSMPKRDFEKLRGFDENFFVASGEDRELAMRALKAGIRVVYDPSIVALHNDWAGTSIRDYCRRQRVYTQTEPLFASKYGPANPRAEMARKNSPPNAKRDGLKLTASKLAKGCVGSKLGQEVLIGMCAVLERIAPDSRPLHRLYRLAIAGAIYRGYGEGLAKLESLKAEQRHLQNETAAG